MVKTLKGNIERSQDVHSYKEAKNNTKSSKEQERSIKDLKLALQEKFKLKRIHSFHLWSSMTNKEKVPNNYA